jgi:glutamine synthetase
VFESVSVAADHNQITMEIMRRVADATTSPCLLHEAFGGVNGSGKHNNWSLATSGENLLNPGATPRRTPFLVFLMATLKACIVTRGRCACDRSSGNDHRLGANERRRRSSRRSPVRRSPASSTRSRAAR